MRVPVQMWQGWAKLPPQMWEGRAKPRCRCGRGEPSPGADVTGVSASPNADVPGVGPSPAADVAGMGPSHGADGRVASTFSAFGIASQRSCDEQEPGLALCVSVRARACMRECACVDAHMSVRACLHSSMRVRVCLRLCPCGRGHVLSRSACVCAGLCVFVCVWRRALGACRHLAASGAPHRRV